MRISYRFYQSFVTIRYTTDFYINKNISHSAGITVEYQVSLNSIFSPHLVHCSFRQMDVELSLWDIQLQRLNAGEMRSISNLLNLISIHLLSCNTDGKKENDKQTLSLHCYS